MNELHKKLKSRHIAMIALGGSIGTGIFVSSGNAIYLGGPGGAVLAFMIIGVMVYFLMTSLGEMSALEPITGTFCDYTSRFVDPALGFAMSYNYWFNWAITVAVDLSAAAIVMQYWFPHTPVIYWSALFFALIFLLNIFTVGLYGEIEYWFSAIKIATVIIFIVAGFLMILGVFNHQPIGFHNWHVGDAPFHNGWFGIFSVMLIAGFAFQGTEIFGITAGEAKNPKESIPKAVRNIFWRILVFYILAIVVINFIIPYTNPQLVNANNDVSLSPFTIVFEKLGLQSAATIINIIVLTAVLSAANASMYTATRTLWSMAKRGIAPKALARVTKKGVPLLALVLTSLFGAATFLSSLFGSGKIFIWLVNISALSGFIAWLGIAISHYRFRKAYILQGRDLASLPYRAKLFPIGPIFTFALCILIIIGQQFTTNQNFNWGSFIGTYINIPVFLALYLGYKFYARSKIVPLNKCQFIES
ncbi:MAG TPA: amino acid permease [Gammaproteobacteria bacterium]|nr:amino acid permease [Gammaproteobacteria bacterium]